MTTTSGWVVGVLAALHLAVASPRPAEAQEPRPALEAEPSLFHSDAPDGPGVVGTGLLLRRLDGVKRVLMIGAHPDDEDTGLLATLARVHGAETAYLSLTRGDGGQNLIGPELREGLGVIRTGELVAARAVDGATQRFTRAFDFGFSKSAEETLAFWPREEVLADVVWAVRRFRPQVIVSVFQGTEADGHGHHQAAGILAREAFGAAADPERFPEQVAAGAPAWAAARLVHISRRSEGFRMPSEGEEIPVPLGAFDPLLGRSDLQLAMEIRSLHRSQDMGAGRPPGPALGGVTVLEQRVEGDAGGLFAGIDTTLVGLAEEVAAPYRDPLRAELEAYRRALARARDAVGLDPSGAAPPLAEGLGRLGAAIDAARRAAEEESSAGRGGARATLETLERRRALVEEALMASAGIQVDVRAAADVLVPGQAVRVEVTLWNGSPWSLEGAEVELVARSGWTVRPDPADAAPPPLRAALEPGELRRWGFEVDVPRDAEPSRLYYLEEPRAGAMYRWPADPSLWGLPRGIEAVAARARFAVTAGPAPAVTLERARPWRYVGVDQAFGEYVEPVLVLPAVSVTPDPDATVWPAGLSEGQSLTVTLRGEAEGGAAGRARLEPPPGWSVEPRSLPFELVGPGSETTLSFLVRPEGDAPPAGEHRFRAVAETSDGAYVEAVRIVDYPHIARAALFTPAEIRMTVVPVAVRPGLRVGYVMGTGDDGPAALRQIGAEVELLDEERVRSGDFADLDVLVLGIRAYEARTDVRAANASILEFARRGGVVVNQYNQYQFSDGGYAPHTFVIGRPAPRVSDETRPVRVLEPDAPALTTPNRIVEEDFAGWVQERGLYFASAWSGEWVPLLEMSDVGEPPRRGGLLVAPVGEGLYVYTGLSFFRQWAAGVGGAYRLFANLVSLEPAAWRAWLARR